MYLLYSNARFARARARARMCARAVEYINMFKHSGLPYPKFIADLASPIESYLAICILLVQNLPIASISIGVFILIFHPEDDQISIF